MRTELTAFIAFMVTSIIGVSVGMVGVEDVDVHLVAGWRSSVVVGTMALSARCHWRP